MLGGIFLQVFVDMCISLFLCFSSLVVGLVTHCGCEYLLLGVDVVGTVFVHRVVTSVLPLG